MNDRLAAVSIGKTLPLLATTVILWLVLFIPVAESSAKLWPSIQSPLGVDPALERQIDGLMAQMSVEHKVGQIIQAEIRYVEPEDVRTYHLGSILNGGGAFPGDHKRSGADIWLALADAFYHASMDASDGGIAIPLIWGTDAVHGNSGVYGATLFPHNIGLGATRNPDLIRRIAEITAIEVTASGLGWTFAPTLAVARDDRWGRTYESYSEDPMIVSQFAKQMVEGLQGEVGSGNFLGSGRILATAKHFLGDGGTLGGQDRGNTLVSEAELIRVHAPGYITAIEAGVQTIMVSYSNWNGVKMHGNGRLLTDVLKQRMGFDGLLVSDWNGFEQVKGCTRESCAAAINAGIDMLMAPMDWKALWKNTLEQVKQGDIPMSRLDDAVRRILRVKLRAGLFEKGAPASWPNAGKMELMGSVSHRSVARQAVRESLVLLKNNGRLLPLAPQARVLVAGPGADNISMQTGGWTLTWQGTENPNSDFPGATSIYKGIEAQVNAAGGQAVLSVDGSYSDKPDVAIVVWGEEPYAEYMGDLRFIHYQPGKRDELELLEKLKADGIPVVSVFLSGRPLWINPHLNASDALVAAWLPGSEGGGVADVLFRTIDGEIAHDFTGRLSFSWPARADQTDLNIHSQPYDPLFAFGFGMTVNDVVEMADVRPLNGVGPDAMQLADMEIFSSELKSPWALGVNAGAALDKAYDDGSVSAPSDIPAEKNDLPQVHVTSKNARGGAVQMDWGGADPAYVWVTRNKTVTGSSRAIDMTQYALSDGAIKFDLMLKSGDPAGLRLGMGCRADNACGGGVDLSASISAENDMGVWRSFEVELECFAQRGMDFTSLVAPFGIGSDRPLQVAVSNIRIVAGPGNAQPADCELESFIE
jgi:beta-glucosidase